ncbi:MAG: hypothetical protein WBV82_07905 [Myxococcaceae bacterium]
MSSICIALTAFALSAVSHPELARAEEAWFDGRYEQVLPHLTRALDSEVLTSAERVRAWELTALTHSAFDRAEPAVDAFRHVLGLDGAWRPGPAVSPKIRDLFGRALAEGPLPRPQWHPDPQLAQSATGAVDTDTQPKVLKQWWFWAGVGVVAAAAGGAAVWASQPYVPPGNLGTGALTR